MKLCTLVGLLMKGSKFVHFTNEAVYIGGFTDQRVEVFVHFTDGNSEFLNTFTDKMCTLH